MNNHFIDQLAKDALHDYQAPYDQADWARFEHKLVRRGPLLPRLWAFKGVEALLLALALFTAIHLATPETPQKLPVSSSGQGATRAAGLVPQETVPENARSTQQQHLDAANPSAATAMDKNTGRTNTPTAPNAPALIAVSRAQNAAAVSERAARAVPPTPVEAFLAAATSETPAQMLGIPIESPSAANAIIAAIPGEASFDEANRNLGYHFSFAKGTFPVLFPGASQNQQPLALLENPTKRNDSDVRPPGRKKPTRQGLLFGAGFAPEATFRGPNASASIGFAMQADLAYGFSEHIYLETGLQYSLKRFYDQNTYTINEFPAEPPFVEVTENRGSSASLLSIPLTARLLFNQKNGTTFYVSGGFAANMVGFNLVTVERTAQQTQGSGTVSMAYDNRGYEQREEPGFFQKTNAAHQNFFASAHASVGFQCRANHKASIFVEQRYQQALTGFGRNKTHMGTLGLVIGVRVKM